MKQGNMIFKNQNTAKLFFCLTLTKLGHMIKTTVTWWELPLSETPVNDTQKALNVRIDVWNVPKKDKLIYTPSHKVLLLIP